MMIISVHARLEPGTRLLGVICLGLQVPRQAIPSVLDVGEVDRALEDKRGRAAEDATAATPPVTLRNTPPPESPCVGQWLPAASALYRA